MKKASSVLRQAPHHLICRDLNETLNPPRTRGIKQDLSADDVRAQKLCRVCDAAINVRLGRKINDGSSVFAKRCVHRLRIGNVAVNKAVTCLIQTFQIVQISGVGQGIEVCDLAVGCSSSNSRTKAEPIKPAPPVMKISCVFCSQLSTLCSSKTAPHGNEKVPILKAGCPGNTKLRDEGKFTNLLLTYQRKCSIYSLLDFRSRRRLRRFERDLQNSSSYLSDVERRLHPRFQS